MMSWALGSGVRICSVEGGRGMDDEELVIFELFSCCWFFGGVASVSLSADDSSSESSKVNLPVIALTVRSPRSLTWPVLKRDFFPFNDSCFACSFLSLNSSTVKSVILFVRLLPVLRGTAGLEGSEDEVLGAVSLESGRGFGGGGFACLTWVGRGAISSDCEARVLGKGSSSLFWLKRLRRSLEFLMPTRCFLPAESILRTFCLDFFELEVLGGLVDCGGSSSWVALREGCGGSVGSDRLNCGLVWVDFNCEGLIKNYFL